MERVVNALTAAGASRGSRLVGYPDECPRCHTKLVPKSIGIVACGSERDRPVEEAMQCTNAKCEGIFVAIYNAVSPQDNPPRYTYARAIPVEPAKPPLSEIIVELSPVFYDTYSQAVVAESLGLGQLTGIGLRKALEFLVKDFAIGAHPGEKDEILGKPLAACIRDYIEDNHVKGTARRAVWLGNDETHYLRKWGSKDIEDLKVLIRLTVNGIENILLAKKYQVEMPDP